MRDALLRGLRAVATPERAAGAQAYMKSAMPFIGSGVPNMRRVCRAVFKEHPLPSAAQWRRQVLSLWREAEFREERYAAIELTGFKAYRDFQTLDTLAMYEEMIVDGAWWDYVDVLAVHRVGDFLLRDFPQPMKRELRKWSVGDDIWKRRTSILCQVNFKRDTDVDLLHDCIAPSLGSTEFFLRKAIGWALRSYASIDAAEVKRYVREHEHEMSGLSKREALKHAGKFTRTT
jgi:3-methyladenine DNA glycosylase AlkD